MESDGTFAGAILLGEPTTGAEIPGYLAARPSEPIKVEDRVLGGFGQQREDMARPADGEHRRRADRLARLRRATGHLSPARQNLADYFKVGGRDHQPRDRPRAQVERYLPSVFVVSIIPEEAGTIETAFPVLLGGHDGLAPLSDQSYREVAREHKTFLLEDLWEAFRGRAKVIDLSCLESETTQGAIERLKQEATTAVRDGCELLVLSDRTVYEGDRRYLDPHLALAAVDLALREHRASGEANLRRLRHRPALGGHPQRP